MMNLISGVLLSIPVMDFINYITGSADAQWSERMSIGVVSAMISFSYLKFISK